MARSYRHRNRPRGVRALGRVSAPALQRPVRAGSPRYRAAHAPARARPLGSQAGLLGPPRRFHLVRERDGRPVRGRCSASRRSGRPRARGRPRLGERPRDPAPRNRALAAGGGPGGERGHTGDGGAALVRPRRARRPRATRGARARVPRGTRRHGRTRAAPGRHAPADGGRARRHVPVGWHRLEPRHRLHAREAARRRCLQRVGDRPARRRRAPLRHARRAAPGRGAPDGARCPRRRGVRTSSRPCATASTHSCTRARCRCSRSPHLPGRAA